MDSATSSRYWRCVALALAALWTGGGCQSNKPPEVSTEATVLALNASPKLGDFVIEAQNSIRLQTGGLVIAGGDLGARGAGSGPFLSGGVAIDLSTGVAATTTRNVIADSVRLGTGVTVGDIQTNRLVDGRPELPDTGNMQSDKRAVLGAEPVPCLRQWCRRARRRM